MKAGKGGSSVRRLFLLVGLFLVALPGRAQQPSLHDDLLDDLAGHWVITGTIAGAATTHDLDAEWVLDRHYLRLHEISRERDRAGRSRYEAYVHIGWNPATATYGCAWLDTFGTAPRAAGRLAFAFARDGQVTLRNVMTWHADSRTWDWVIVNVDGARSSTFATLVLRRP
jgi:hypothetical protein